MRALLACLSVLFGLAGAAAAQPPTAGDITAAPAVEFPQLSPDGNRMLYLRRPQAGDEDGRPTELHFLDVSDMDAISLRRLPLPDVDVRWATWGNNERVLLGMTFVSRLANPIIVEENGQRFRQDFIRRSQIMSVRADGTEPVMLFDVDDWRFSSVFSNALDQMVDILPNDPDHVLIPARTGRTSSLNLFKVNINTGDTEQVDTGRAETIAYFTNGEGVSVMRWDWPFNSNRIQVRVRARDGDRWRTVTRMPISEFGRVNREYQWAARADAFDEVLVYAYNETDTIGLYRYNFAEETLGEPVWSHETHDIDSVITNPFTDRPIAAVWADERTRIDFLDDSIAPHINALAGFFGEDLITFPVQEAGSRMLVSTRGPSEPTVYHLYDTVTNAVRTIGPAQPTLFDRDLANVSIHPYTARDGQELFGYLTHPAGEPVGTVLLTHGGPERRDYYDFDALAQLLAGNGYLVFQPQFRGSSGFGRAFASAGYGEWGGLIQRDITDGVLSLVEAGLAQQGRICAAGFSFGGYSSLMQVIENPDLYQCAIAGAAVTDLASFLEQREESSESVIDYLRTAIGYPDEALLTRFSPLQRVDEVTVPILVLHGPEDRVVPINQGRRMHEAVTAAGGSSIFYETYGGHNFTRRSLFESAELMRQFLALHLPPEDDG